MAKVVKPGFTSMPNGPRPSIVATRTRHAPDGARLPCRPAAALASS